MSLILLWLASQYVLNTSSVPTMFFRARACCIPTIGKVSNNSKQSLFAGAANPDLGSRILNRSWMALGFAYVKSFSSESRFILGPHQIE